MLTAINTILEMAATLICVNYLFGKRYYFSIYDAVFMVAEVTLIESANYFGLSKGMALFGYVGIYIYELLKFKCSIRKANVNLVLVAIYCIFAQVICSMPVFALENWVSVDWVMLGINFLVLVLSVVISKTGYFYIGLSKVREILLKYHAGIKVSCEKEEFVFEFILPKIKDSHAAVL